MRTVYFKTCEHPLFENNCEKLKKLIKTNFYIFKLKNPIEFSALNIKMGEDYNELWWAKEDRKLLFLKITLKGICMYLSGNKLIEAYDDCQPIQCDSNHNHFFLTQPVIIDDETDSEMLNIFDKVFGMKSPYDHKWLNGFNIEARTV